MPLEWTRSIVRRIQLINNHFAMKLPTKILSRIWLSLIALIVVFIVAGVVKGNDGNPYEADLNTPEWKDNGPLELSPDRGRYALTYSVAENKSVFYSIPVAQFATPDLGYKDGKYVSLFAPAVSFIVLPGYLIGKAFNLAQVGTIAVVAIFAIANFWLIFLLAKRLTQKTWASLMAAITFLFATPAFAYSGSLYQHHISTFLILVSIYIYQKQKGFLGLSLIWFLVALSVPVDNPNLFMMAPIGIASLFRIINFKTVKERIEVRIKWTLLATFATVIIPVSGFMYFNYLSYGSPFQLAGTVASVKAVDNSGKPTLPSDVGTEDVNKILNPDLQTKSAVSFFDTRNALEGFYVHTISPDRGMTYYTPVLLLAILGMVLGFKKNKEIFNILVSVFAVNLLLYSMWGDPWGGWAFGSRYLIPSYAILAIFIGVVLAHWSKKYWIYAIFVPLLLVSFAVNTIGALGSNRNPPQVEVLALEELSGQVQKYTVERNWDFIQSKSKSYIYGKYFVNHITPVEYFYILLAILSGISILLLMLNYFEKGGKENERN